jgi:PHD/YefM family antitoxin component YafN of YafNO toxin-antitoxin module
MATNMDKSFYQAPQGLDQLSAEEEPIEIEIEDPEAVRISAGDFTFEMTKEEDEDEFEKNLAEEMSEGELATIAGDLGW